MKLGNNPLPQKSKSQVLSILMLLIFLVSIFYVNRTRSTVPISEHRFEAMMLNKDVKQVTLITNQNLVEVTLKPESFTKEPYKSELENRVSFYID